ncbi:MAG TPA: hypothetical protein VM925_20085 [Labilithrix sp.]|nr:hypothetical protein [Labilithrix sp.]
MKRRNLSPLSVVLFPAACATTSSPQTKDRPRPDAGPEPETPAEAEEDEAPHALGTITLGETHAAEGGRITPVVSASFVPDSARVPRCTRQIGACEIAEAPRCATGANPGCNANEICVFDEQCTPRCQKVPVCSLQCLENEARTLDAAGKGVCTKLETFDAGPLAFAGTTTTITLFPPYVYEGGGSSAPFLAGAELRAQAQGATGAGFDAFDESFTATTFIQSSPKLSSIAHDDLFGTFTVPVSWVPGNDSILVTITGDRGVVTCKGKDAGGRLEIPRVAIDAQRVDVFAATTISCIGRYLVCGSAPP